MKSRAAGGMGSRLMENALPRAMRKAPVSKATSVE